MLLRVLLAACGLLISYRTLSRTFRQIRNRGEVRTYRWWIRLFGGLGLAVALLTIPAVWIILVPLHAGSNRLTPLIWLAAGGIALWAIGEFFEPGMSAKEGQEKSG